MSDEELIELIEECNQGRHQLKRVTKDVYQLKLPEQFFYLVKSSREFIGIIQYYNYNLHWLTVPELRGKGLLSDPIKDIILPDIMKVFKKDHQRITISQGLDNPEASYNLAIKCGFTLVEDDGFKYEMMYKP
ncbi:hypothetical protein V6R21_06275 [Limibacter armeniacum]|uniref:hypothetical protein n=1 Tax=Limibacter armeniacum TaxID=466084 RepID=UPI002FE55376